MDVEASMKEFEDFWNKKCDKPANQNFFKKVKLGKTWNIVNLVFAFLPM